MIRKRDLVLNIILTVVTCGIYGLVWMVQLNDDSMAASNEQGSNGVTVLLLSIVTCGIYGIYWAYVMGRRIDQIKGDQNGNSSILYLILSIFGFGIIWYCIAQNELNKYAEGSL